MEPPNHEILADSLRDLLEEFLHLKSQEIPQPTYCAVCGSFHSYVFAQFTLDGDEDQAWSIPLPFCLLCHPELAGRMASAA
ncbi:MAG: hypothetical protein ACRD3B_08505 [Candidatus Sulfotelmatobacter sp.]